MHTHYDNLKVARDAPDEVIKAAYRALSQRHHPDRNPGDAAAAQAMQAINAAYAVLSDLRQRRAYDAWLVAQDRGGGTSVARPRDAGRNTVRPRTHAARPPMAEASAGAPLPATHGATFKRWWVATLLAVSGLLVAGAVLHRERTPSQSDPGEVSTDTDAPRWEIRGLDTPAPSRPTQRVAVPAPTAPPPAPPLPVPPAPPPLMASPAAMTPGLPIVADPNGRPWPLGPAYVEGLPQDQVDGMATVTVDNRGNAWPAFVKLVALDQATPLAVRHVYVPPMQAFRIDGIRPGRYELRFQNLVTGELSRSGGFTLRQEVSRDAVRYSELDIALYRVPGGESGVLPLAAGEF